MFRVFRYFVFIAFVILIAVSALPNTATQEKTLVIPMGSAYNAAKVLSDEGIINNKYAFWILAQASKFIGRGIKAGEYSFDAHTSLLAVIRKMITGDVVMRRLIIPEGFTNEQILTLIRSEPSLKGDIIKNYQEGGLLPETYFFTYGDTKQAMLDKMNESMSKAINTLWSKRDTSIDTVIKDTQDLISLASIVEKEARLHEDRSKIASVFLNRLKLKMKLEADPTTIYAITLGKYNLERPLRYKDLEIQSPFNTYYAYGLPPTAIANPGLECIKAILNPINTDYMYFVIKDCEGGHVFSRTLKEHKKNVQAFRKLKCQ